MKYLAAFAGSLIAGKLIGRHFARKYPMHKGMYDAEIMS